MSLAIGITEKNGHASHLWHPWHAGIHIRQNIQSKSIWSSKPSRYNHIIKRKQMASSYLPPED